MSDTLYAPARLEVGTVVRQTFAVIGRRFAPLALLALVFAGIPRFIVGLLRIHYAQPSAWAGDPNAKLHLILLGAVAIIAPLLAAYVLQAAVIHLVVADINEQPVSFGASLRTGLRFALPACLIAIIYSIGIGIGSMLLIIPGIMVACRWAVALPAEVVEKAGIAGALGRSAALTAGSRWRVFLVLLVFGVFLIIIGLLGGFLTVILAGGSILTGWPNVVMGVIVAVLSGMVGAAIIASLYTELRRVREGATPEMLSQVFD